MIDYVNQGHYPGQVQVDTGILRAGRSSFTTATTLFQDERRVALCDSVMVHAVDGLSRPIPDKSRTLLAQHTIAVG